MTWNETNLYIIAPCRRCLPVSAVVTLIIMYDQGSYLNYNGTMNNYYYKTRKLFVGGEASNGRYELPK